MKHVKTKNKYVASNVVLYHNPLSGKLAATSYNWWIFLTKNEDGKIIFNDYAYSTSTRGHQGKVRKQLAQLGIKVDHYVESHESLSACWQPDAIKILVHKIQALTDAIGRKGSRATTNAKRTQLIEQYKAKILEITTIK